MPHPKPNRFESIADYLDACGFTVNMEFFVCGEIRFLTTEICGHTVSTFADKMVAHGWVPVDGESPILWPR